MFEILLLTLVGIIVGIVGGILGGGADVLIDDVFANFIDTEFCLIK